MHASRLVELAAVIASQHRLLCQQQVDADFWAADQFWVLSRARINEWARSLRNCETIKLHENDFDPVEFWAETKPVIEEVLLSEICTRLWCASLSTIEEQRHPGELDPIARSVFIASLEARRRALRLILFAKGLPNVATSTVNELRLNCQLWTDYLLADLSSLSITKQFCFDRTRLQEDHHVRLQQRCLIASDTRRDARLMAMRYSLASRPWSPTVCGELNSEIGAVILSCLPISAFDGSGTQRVDLPISSSPSDMFSIDILADLYGTVGSTRFDSQSGLKDHR